MEQYNHCIFVASNYTNNKRKGLHFLYNEENLENIYDVIKEYGKKDGISVYFLNTDSPSIQSISKKDAFFGNMAIGEGTNKKDFDSFFKSINNQISAFDIALLFLTRKELTLSQLENYLFHFYCIFSIKFQRFPFKEKLSLINNELFFKMVRQEFGRKNPVFDKDTLICKNEEVIFSKFLNCDNGFEEMNETLEIFLKLQQVDSCVLDKAKNSFVESCNRYYKNKNKEPNITKKFILNNYDFKFMQDD